MSVCFAVTAFVAFSVGKVRYRRLHTVRAVGRSNTAGYYLALSAVLPLAPLYVLYAAFGRQLLQYLLSQELPDYAAAWDPQIVSLFFEQVLFQVEHRNAPASPIALVDSAAGRYAQLQGSLRLVLVAVSAALAGLGYAIAWRRIVSGLPLRRVFERGGHIVLFACAAIAVLTTAGIVASLVFETARFFAHEDGPSVASFLFGTSWNAQTGRSFGVLPLLLGTLLIAAIALVVAVPIGLLCAVYLSEYASPQARESLKPVLELLAGIPTVVYGFFAAMLVAPLIRDLSHGINDLSFVPDGLLAAQPTNALAAGLVMAIMIIPLMSSLCDDILRTIPGSLRDGALALGATQAETITKIVLPAALPGIVAALLLSALRAIGETMIVVMAAGGRAIMTLDPTSDMTTVTHQIVTILTGDTSFDSARTLSAFALGFALFGFTLVFNIIALRIVRSYRVRYG